jgi:mannose-6-phosphate isomerase-like protein (cupin superfamily)
MNNKIKSNVIKANEGEAYWQPGVKGNCITIKISPWNILETNHTVFHHELPSGGEVGAHSHEANEEIFICLEGEGIMTIDNIEHEFKKHDVAFIAPKITHHIRTISAQSLKYIVVISPTGLEERLKLMGIAKKSNDEAAPESFDSIIGKLHTHGVT